MLDTAESVAPESSGGTPRRRRRWLRRLLIGIAVVAIGYLSWSVLGVVTAARADDRATTDAIVVLGAAQYDGTPSPVLQARLDHALGLYEEGVAPKIVLTGSKQAADRFTEAYAGFTYLLEEGVPEEAMDVVTDGESTYESLAATAHVLDDNGIDEVTLVSDGYHNRRLLGIVSELGLDGAVSPSSDDLTPGRVLRESAVVAAGELIGFRRLQRFF